MSLDNGGGLEDDALEITWLIRAALVLVVAGLCLKAYVLYSKRVYRGTTTMSGKTVIVTGGNAGIGKETAKELARRKARVILACRNLQRAQAAARDIFAETGEAVVVKQLDLCSFKSVRAFAADVVRTEPRLDVLINNAGNIPDKLMLTEDGYEVGLQSNYLGHFLLTILLTGVTVNAVHPGAVDTGIAGEERLIAYLFRILVNFYGRFLLVLIFLLQPLLCNHLSHHHHLRVHPVRNSLLNVRATLLPKTLPLKALWSLTHLLAPTVWEGAQTSLYAAVDDRFATETGFYLEECARGIVSHRAINRKCVESTFARTISLCHLDPTEVEKLFELPGGRAA
ncbi:retinol dehydrogenase 12-like isoform X3 [Dermacentor variabilis]|uniref:retinol dehydrogenase 12-like isoform X3 n=1 Tax=Dermacentor variabilis TaxID=34621 RepID=UPI003F5BB0BF